MNKQDREMKRLEYLGKLEVAIKKDPLTEFDSILTDYYQEFVETPEETKELIALYPQFPQTTEFLYESDLELEKFMEEESPPDIDIDDGISQKEILVKEANILQLAETDSNDFISEYLEHARDYHPSDEFFEKLSKNKKTIVPKFIKEINSLMTIHQNENDVKYKINSILLAIGMIRCERSVKFLNSFLEAYMKELERYDSGNEKNEYVKYTNLDFFHLIDCMVKQQNKKSIPYITKARDFFPKEYTDHIICQIAIGRIRKREVDGYLPMEALEITMPSGKIMDSLSGGQHNWKDTFEEDYGEYFKEE